ncbi:hypothetical protein [Bacillus altitudinis]|uniref:hypothetical protein n=1 Tax=Bacillus altitudinis TaxID=293387 RepID=UPI001C212714|nr:hypothetical protein [Bacillus altitudinis]MBU8855302.1 hypothetical protein [Bacillus sp. FJAT-26377]MCY7454264.1 hypothetical protein [Bacillus altitudinis]
MKPTCQNCMIFDETTSRCALYQKVDYDNIFVYNSCQDKVPKNSQNKQNSLSQQLRWFTSENKDYSCWILNKTKLHLVGSSENDTNDNERRYRSPIPLHNHGCPALAKEIVWTVDEYGFGSYGLLIQGEVVPLQ